MASSDICRCDDCNYARDTGSPIPHCSHENLDGWDDGTEADIRLIAAAPESQFALCVSRGWVTAKSQPEPDHSQRAIMDAMKQSLVEAARKGHGVITEEFL